MGRRGRGRGRGKGGEGRYQRNHFRDSRPDVFVEKRQRTDNGSWAEPVTRNEKFEEYYKEQGICPPEEWDAMLETLGTPLPITFRISGGGKFASDLSERLERDFMSHFLKAANEDAEGAAPTTEAPAAEAPAVEAPAAEAPGAEVAESGAEGGASGRVPAAPTASIDESGNLTIQGETVPPPHRLPWYPQGLAWKFFFTKKQLRKEPLLKKLHEFIVAQTEAGAITRQEEVSMVPPMFLDVRPGHRVLDTCAAPGSKTTQLLEALHAPPARLGGPLGFVCANDAEAMRCNMLSRQSKRLLSPSLVVTNLNAQLFPNIPDAHDPASYAGKPRGEGKPEAAEAEAEAEVEAEGAAPAASSGKGGARRKKHLRNAKFDRILCDVPCSGDGTARKSAMVWTKWQPGNGNGLHVLQVGITLRAAEMLAVGGRIVYSTCSLNPIEDEAVVAEVLRRCGGALELVDPSAMLPELKRQPGLQRWKVRDKDSWYSRWEGDGEFGFKLTRSMFPDERSDAFPLDRCMRFLPHHQDTGGFFVCVLEKVSQMDRADDTPYEHSKGRREGRPDGVKDAGARAAGAPAADAEAVPAAAAEVPAAEVPAAEAPAADATAVDASVSPAAAAEASADAPEAAVEVVPAPVPAAEAPATTGEAAAPSWKKTAPEGPSSLRLGRALTWAERREVIAARGEKWRRAGIDPLVPFVDEEVIGSIVGFYGLGEGCPISGSLLARNLEKYPKRLYYVSEDVKRLIVADETESLRVTNAGVKMFERYGTLSDVPRGGCLYRIAQEGLPTLLPYLTRQIVRPSLPELRALLAERQAFMPEDLWSNLTAKSEAGDAKSEAGDAKSEAGDAKSEAGDAKSEAEAPVTEAPKPKLREISDPAFLDSIRPTTFGCCVALLRPEDAATVGLPSQLDESGMASPLAIICWRGRCRFQVLLSSAEAQHALEGIQAKSEPAADGPRAEEPEAVVAV